MTTGGQWPGQIVIVFCQDESGLCNDMGFLAHLPELCDITFLVGQDKGRVHLCLLSRKMSGLVHKQCKTLTFFLLTFFNIGYLKIFPDMNIMSSSLRSQYVLLEQS